MLDNESLMCWGRNSEGQLGRGSTTSQFVSLGTGRTAVSVSTGNLHTCAILDDGSLKCWGSNNEGQLGIGSTSNQNTPQSVSLGAGRTAVSVSAGDKHTCAVLDDGSLKCWGSGDSGQLGNGSWNDETTPTQISGLTATPAYAGSIYGRPSSVTAGAHYTFTANNTFGSSNDTIWIEVLPAYDYGNETLWLTRNQTMTARSPIITGGPYTATIWPPVPSGMFWNASNGTFWGTPDMNQTWTEYYINVSNSTGSDTIIVNIGIGDILPYVTYTNTTLTYIRGFEIDDVLPTHLGGHIGTVETYPALPEGLSIADPTTWTNARPNGTLYGLPTELAGTTTYEIWFNNTIGSFVVNLTITVLPGYDYGNGTVSLTRNETMTPRSPIITGGPYTTVQLNGTLPTGMFFNASNGTLWGTPSVVVATTMYTVYMANANGEDEVTFNITVAEIPPILDYNLASMSYRRGFFSEHPYPILTGGEVATFEISPALPAGMSFNGSSGFFSGVPMVAMNATLYTVWANNSLGSSSWNLTIEVLPGITHASTSFVSTRNVTVQPYTPTINIVERNLSIDPPLPPGLVFDATNATISGASLVPWPTLEHRIRLWNATGEDWLNITVTAYEILPYVVYSTNASSSLNAYGLDPLVPLGSGGTPVNWSADFDGLEGLALLRAGTGRTLDGEGNTLCAITADERVICWGANDMGQLGQGNTNAQSNPVVVTLASASLPVALSVGETHTCVVLANGNIDCWGQNDQGQLGLNFSCVYGSFSSGCNGNFAVPQANTVIPPSTLNFTQVTVGQSHTCALLEDGQALCWGDNTYGQLGDNEVTGSLLAMPVNTSLRFISLSAGTAHTCGVATDGSLWCWGRNSFGQLGDSTTQDRFLPTEVLMPQGYTARSVSTGGEHTCAVLNGSQPACWGRNSQGQLGDGTVLGKIAPRIVTATGLGTVTSVVAGPAQTCVLDSDHAVWCWGASGSSAFLNTSGISLVPIELPRLNGMNERQVAVGQSHVCTVNARYDLMCRGSNQYGQLPGHTGASSSSFVEWKDLMLAVPHHPAGTVYGAPSNGSGNYLVTLNVSNIIGTHTFNHSVEVSDAFQYPTSLVEIIRGQATTPISPTVATHATGQFTITPLLPQGLLLNSTTGTLTGTPTSNMSQQTFVLVHANSQGFTFTAFSLVIYEPAAHVVYPGSTINLTRGESTLLWVPTVSNGTVMSWSIVPALPAGLTFSNGVLSGTPTVNWTTTNYRIYANNTGGVTFVDLSLTVVEPLPDLILGLTDIVGVRGEALTRTTVSNAGGKVATWTITPSLPDGLTFVNGVLSGTPTVNSSAVVYTVRATNSGGTASLTFTLTVNEPAAVLFLDPLQFSQVRGEAIAPIFILNGGGLVANWSITPALPEGLVFEGGHISGTPSVNATEQTYTVTAINTGGSDSVQFTLVVVEPAPAFTYGASSFVLSRNTPFEAMTPTSLGGAIASWSISPSLPSGMFFDERRGVIQGLAVSTSPTIEYTVTASNSGGESLGYFTLQVLNPAPVFTLPNDEIAVVENKAMTRFAPFVGSDVVVNTWSWAVEGGDDLPPGLVFDQTTGAFSGTPSDGEMTLRILLTASNDGGTYSEAFNFSVLGDFDSDGIADIDDEDDDNDGYSDIEELTRNSDPRDASSTPIEGFEVIIPGTEISLGAWDIIGMLTGIPLILWLSFSLVTRNKRTQGFVKDMRQAKTRQELDAVAERYEKAIMWKLIGPHQGMRLERIRAEADDAIEERERAFKYKMEESVLEEEKAGAELEAEFFDEVDQTPLVEKAEKAEAGERTGDGTGDEDESGDDESEDGSIIDESNDGNAHAAPPSASTPATSVDEKGYEWYVPENGDTSYFRVIGSDDDWVKFEN